MRACVIMRGKGKSGFSFSGDKQRLYLSGCVGVGLVAVGY